MAEFFYYLFGVIAVVFAAVAVTAKNVIRGGVALLGTFVALGGLYFSVGAEFIGIVQVIVYGGAIIVLYLFALMTLDLKRMEGEPVRLFSVAAGGFLSLALVAIIVYGGFSFFGSVHPAVSTAKGLAGPLFYRFLLPFEVVSVLLLVATIGAVSVGRGKE
ncbi:NADH-ubiquinone/plastoquinone oxidoreductase chain 6 [Thermovibrio ammonificans HB-1]|uniref:NADH-quinone oxidoreductase subunit J n=1 Tax=Thermovibrio ammonificans (strain DSM 15698 / JCM 12110 / HB-1) TaxID=648996 RepID=E8T6C4_THEA1|nr:NADH-quinone oxidoreductase subunit J [Thermovibrio ammonificans]ADU96708.1 NADH-ubiquinone/plastoquinone oxidoreductase chain 6 [Thermovibrio ammonificans HB-1]